MKTKKRQLILTLACALCLSPGIATIAVAETNPPPRASAAAVGNFGYDFHEGRSNKIERVYAVTPTHVQVLYEGGKRGRKIPRQSLPPELAELYPYDPVQAVEHEKQQMEIATRRAAAQQEVARETARQREQYLVSEIARLTRVARDLDREINGEKKKPKSAWKRVRIENLVNEWQQVQRQRARLEEELLRFRRR